MNCETCLKIICRGCGWEPNATELIAIKTGDIKICPLCGWKPGK